MGDDHGNQVQIGFKGRHYGLFKPTPVTAKQPASAKQPLKKAPAIFSMDDDDEPQDMRSQLEREMERKKKAKQVAEEQAKILEDDPTAYDYDELYDTLKQKDLKRHNILEEEKKKRHPKYIKQLLEKAEHRKQEQDIVYERRLRKDREQEDHLFGDKDKFVTSSYKRKLMEQKKWEEEQAKKDAQDADVTQKKNAMFSFYSGLLDRRNVAAGAEDDAIKRDAERKREEERKRKEEEEAQERLRKEREREEKEREREAKEKEQQEIERSKQVAREARRRSEDRTSDRHSDRRSEERDDKHGTGDKRKHDDDVKHEREPQESSRSQGQDLQEPEKKKRKGGVIDLPLMERPKAMRDAPKRNDDSAVQSARERYLARKAQQAGASRP